MTGPVLAAAAGSNDASRCFKSSLTPLHTQIAKIHTLSKAGWRMSAQSKAHVFLARTTAKT